MSAAVSKREATGGGCEYIFGFGSLMNTSTHATWQTHPGGEEDDGAPTTIPGAVVVLKRDFGYARMWNFRSATGFTALGVIQASSAEEEMEEDGRSTSSSSKVSSDINGVLFRVPREEIPDFDRREVGYDKVEIPLEFLEFLPDSSGSTTQTKFIIGPNDKIWLYVPCPSHISPADENHPLLQSYVDTVLQGCLEWGGEDFAEEFVLSTGGWSRYYLNDTPSSRRPWLFRKDYSTIDRLLSKHSRRTNYGDRRHPEEFASAFNQRMKGTWSLPKRNPNFAGRERELDELRSRFSAQDRGRRRIVTTVMVVGMGGVGKTSLVTEYCYRYFPSEYGLVIWLNAETADTLFTDYGQLLSDLTDTDSLASDKSTEEIAGEVKSRLFRSNVPWLLIFDNIEDHDLLEKFVPRGAGMKGHIIMTTRHLEAQSGNHGTLSLGCLSTSEAVELLRRSAGPHNIAGPSNAAAADELCATMGNLPLALSMAAAYMRQCDVEISEYLKRYTASENNGQSLLRRTFLLDYSMTVQTSLSLILPKIKERNATTLEVLHLLSYLGPDGITKPLLRTLLSAATDHDQMMVEKNTAPWILLATGFTGLVVSSVVIALPGVKKHRAGICVAFGAATASLILALKSTKSREFEKPPDVRSSMKKAPSKEGFSMFEYEESDISWELLKSFSLLSVKEGRGCVHRLLQQAMRSCQSEDDSRRYIMICINALASIWTFKPSQIETWKESLPILEHVKSVVSHSQQCCLDAEYTLKVGLLSKEAGVLSAMALNAFEEARASLALALKLLESKGLTNKPDFRRARAGTLHELSKVNRFQGRYEEAHSCLNQCLELSNADDCLKADTLHELGILEVKKHNLNAAMSFLRRSLELRRDLSETGHHINASSTLHQLAAIHVQRKKLDEAKAILQEALSQSRQIGQRAATLKQLARVTIRQGDLEQAETFLDQALELYLEAYGKGALHINVAAVKFQLGALASQRGQLDAASLHFNECLRIRRHVYGYAGYAQPSGSSSEKTNPIHLEVSCVLHELGTVGFAQKRFSQSLETLQSEKLILEKLEEKMTTRNERIYQARLTNLTWLRKCAKDFGNESMATMYANERMALRKKLREKSNEIPQQQPHCDSILLEQKAMQCRSLARKFALDKAHSNLHQVELLSSLEDLSAEINAASPGPMKEAAEELRKTVLLWVNKSGRRSPILNSCDALRNVLRSHGVEVND